MQVGIDAINAYVSHFSMDVRTLFEVRGLDLARFDNLKMLSKSVAAPWEDQVTHAVNAARPLVDALSEEERKKIRLLVVATESGLDFGKSLSTYVHRYLGLHPHCRCFEVKQACYGGTAALQLASHFVAADPAQDTSALVICTDVSSDIHGHILVTEGGEASANYAEPALGTGAVAMVVTANPRVLALDLGASGLCTFEVMDTCRPLPGREAADPDGSLLAYLDCLTKSTQDYFARVEKADLVQDFEFLLFHTPFSGLVASAHKRLMREKFGRDNAGLTADFVRRVEPSLYLPARAGNLYAGSLYLALCSLLSKADRDGPFRIGMFSYGSGCSSEFFSGVVRSGAPARVRSLGIAEQVDGRVALSLAEYEKFSAAGLAIGFGTRNGKADMSIARDHFSDRFAGKGLLVLDEIKDFHRTYTVS